ncbi:MAG: hypothetical protein ABJB86_23570 [Bacteroidota bacterium]
MKKIFFALICNLILFSSCQKSISDFDPSTTQGTGSGTTPTAPTNGSGNFVATVDGKQLTFNVTAATLVRSQAANEKRIDVTGTSSDGTKRIILTLGEETSVGNSITVKKYILNAYPEDDPSTPTIDESLDIQGYTTYGIASGSNWMYGVYDEKGSCTVTSCDAAATLISATFATTLTDLLDSTHIVSITAGKLTNIKYTVVN